MEERKQIVNEKILYRKKTIDLLKEGSNYRLTAVIAGPGYGKTIAIRNYCGTLEEAVVWLHILQLDNESQRFWKDFTTQLGIIFPSFQALFAALEYPFSMSDFNEFLHVLQHAIAKKGRCTMVFDNAEHLIGSPIMEFLNRLITAEPVGVSFIVSSNRSLDELRAMGEEKFFPIMSKDLAFTRKEFELLLDMNNRSFTNRQIDEIMHKTEGWPLALSLFLEKTNSEIEEFQIFPKQKVLIEMFWHHYYKNYSEKMRSLLIQLALIPFFTEDMLRRFTGDGYNIDKLLYQLPLDMFVAYNNETGIFTLHGLYRDFLLERKKSLSSEKIRSCFLTAGSWYKENEYYQEALDCFWTCRDYEGFLRVLSVIPNRNRNDDVIRLTLKRLNNFPDTLLHNNPYVNFFRGFLYLIIYQVTWAKEILYSLSLSLEQKREEAHADGTSDIPLDLIHLLGDTYMLLSDIGYLQNTDEMFTYIKKAADVLKNKTRVRNTKLQVTGNHYVLFLTDLKNGGLIKMQKNLIEYAKYAEPITGGSGAGLELLFAGEANYFTGKIDEAEECAVKAATKAKIFEQHDIICNAYFLLMKIAVYRGNKDVAYAMYDEMRIYMEETGATGVKSIYDSAGAWLAIKFVSPEDFPEWVKSKETAYKGKLFAGRERLLYVSYLFAINRHYEAYTVLLELEQMFEERGMYVLRVYDHIYKAIYFYINNQRNKMLSAMYKAYQMTFNNGMTVIYEEFADIMVKIIDCIEKDGNAYFDRTWLLSVKSGAKEMVRKITAMGKADVSRNLVLRDGVSLTEREMEVLRLLSEGLQRNEMSALLGISVNGVKKHISNIYTKLGAMNRVEAIKIAVANGVLEQ